MGNDLDNSDVWKKAVFAAVNLGVLHAQMGQKARTESTVLAILRSGELGKFGYRNGHSRLLRAAYGAAYNGVMLARRAHSASYPPT